MSRGILDLHNLLRWIVIITAVYAIVKGYSGFKGGKIFSKSDKRSGFFYMLACDIQLLIGLALYFLNQWFDVLGKGAETMHNPALRFFSLEHGLGMIIALIIVHIGYASTKKSIPDQDKFKKLFWCSLISLMIILISIPWPFREFLGRPWFPGM